MTTNEITRFRVDDNGGWPHAQLQLTNGVCFLYRNTNVVGYFAADEFWNGEKRKMLVHDFQGVRRMTDRELMSLARQTLARIGLAKGLVHTDGQPELVKPNGHFEKLIPRIKVEWMYPNGANMTQWSYVEIDASNGQVKSVYFDDQSFRTQKPPIDVSIALKASGKPVGNSEMK